MQCRAIRSVCYALVIALVSTIAPTPLNRPAQAQLMPTYAVGVVDFVNESGVQGDLLARLATDAIVVEMSKTQRYDVSITRSRMREAMDKLDIRPPFDKVNLVRLGEELSADAVLQGAVKSVQLAGNGPTRRASVTIVAQMVDQASGETVNGAVQTGTSSARVGYTADDDALITEAINKAAFLAVKTMVDYVIPEATIQMNIGSSEVMLNRGIRDGIKAGMRMIVLRNKEIIGYIEVREVHATDSQAKVVKSMRGIQPEDKARAIFEMPTVGGALKVAPMPSGAPPQSRSSRGAFSKIGKLLLGAAIVFGLISLFRGGRGSEPAPTIGTLGAMEITWDPTKYGHGTNVLELQVLRDAFDNGARPVKVLRDPGDWDAGRTNLRSLYGTAADSQFNYYQLDSNPATTFNSPQITVRTEPYGTTHQYQVRVVYKQVDQSAQSTGGTGDTTGTGTGTDTGTTTATKYFYTPVSNVITATAIEPVLVTDVIAPRYDPAVGPTELLISELQDPRVDAFQWNGKAGADVYYVKVEPVIPGSAPTWQSEIVYGTGPVVSLSQTERVKLATALAGYPDKVMKWRVYSRHQADTSPAWVEGEENRFVIGGTPPSRP